MPRCGSCENCQELKRVQERVLACCNPPFSHAGQDVADLWNAEVARLSCEGLMYYTGTFKCEECSAELVVKMSDWADLGSGTMTHELREKIKGWSCKKGVWRCPLHKEPDG